MKTDFPIRLKATRLAKGLTQKQLGERSGIADPTIRKYESGKLNPKLETIQRLADALQVDFADLAGFTEHEMKLSAEVSLLDKAKEIGGTVYELNVSFAHLNTTGQQKAVDYVKDLAQIDTYKKPENE